MTPEREKGLGPDSAGQSGDTQGLSGEPVSNGESVEQLLSEGQALEAEIVDAIENAPDPEKGPLRPREVPEDDVPGEYLGRD